MRWLSTRFNPLCWLPAFLLFFYSSSSFSASCTPGYPTSTPSIGYYIVAGITAYKYPTASIGCSSAASVDKFWGAGFTGSGSGTGPTACTVTKTSDGSTNQTSITFISGSCPTGYIVSGSQCVQDCAPDCPPADTKGNGFAGFSLTGDIRSSFSGSTCYDSGSSKCAATCGDTLISYSDTTNTSYVTCTTFRYTGSSCTGSDSALSTGSTGVTPGTTATPVNDPPKSSADCPGGSGFAQINNTSMCLASGTNYTSGTNTVSVAGGGSTTVSSTTTINKDGTSTVSTTTTNRDSGGNVIGSYTGTSTGSVNQADGQSGNDKPLNLGPPPAFDGTLPNDPTFNIKTITNPTLSTSIFDVSASCPEPLTFEAMGRSFEITFQPICDLADIIRGIILMMSAIVAIRAVVTK